MVGQSIISVLDFKLHVWEKIQIFRGQNRPCQETYWCNDMCMKDSLHLLLLESCTKSVYFPMYSKLMLGFQTLVSEITMKFSIFDHWIQMRKQHDG